MDAADLSQQVADDQRSYEKDHADAIQSVKDAQADLNDAQKEGDKGKIADATQAVREQQKAVQELEAQWHESNSQIIYDLTLAKVAADGLTDSELKAVDQLAVQMGIKTQADIDAAAGMREQADALFEGIQAQEDVSRENQQIAETTAQLEADKQAAMDGTTQAIVEGAGVSVDAMGRITGSVDVATRSLIAMGYAASKTASATSSIQFGGAPAPKKPFSSGLPQNPFGATHGTKDSGGAGVAGTPYMIGTGAQPEMFIPSTNGTFVPNADKSMGATYHITINNPKGETTDNSIRESLKRASRIGTFA